MIDENKLSCSAGTQIKSTLTSVRNFYYDKSIKTLKKETTNFQMNLLRYRPK